MSDNDIPDDMRAAIWKNISEDKVAKYINEDVDPDTMMKLCDYKYDLTNFLCIKALKRVPFLRKMDEQDLMVLCKYSRRNCISTWKDNHIIRAGEQLDAMYLITDGAIECKDGETKRTQSPLRYYFCGDKIMRWAILNYKRSEEHYDPLPISTIDVHCLADVSAFVLRTVGLTKVLTNLNSLQQLEAMAQHRSIDQRIEEWLLINGFPENLEANIMNCLDKNKLIMEENMYVDVDVEFVFGILPRDIKPSVQHHLGMNVLKEVPMLQKMHEYVLEIIYNHLEPVVYKKDEYIVRAGEPLSKMIFILQGTIVFTTTTSSNTATRTSEITENCDGDVIEIQSYYGEKLLTWASPRNISSSHNAVISTRGVKCVTKVEALMLKAEDLRSVASKCGSQWSLISDMNLHHLVGDARDAVADTGDSSSAKIEPTIQLHQGHDMLLEQLVLIRETMFQFRDDTGQRLGDQRQS